MSRSGPKNRKQRAKLGGRNDRPERTDRSSTTRLRCGNHTFELHLAPELEVFAAQSPAVATLPYAPKADKQPHN
jgi:hypothetical protein